MNTKPEALQLASQLEPMGEVEADAAAELRRLHEVNQMLVETLEVISLFGEDDESKIARVVLQKAKEQA